ncbi:MAG: hypothetical protein RMI34_01160 [Chloroherpetonaceae bacterium]|nr:hypothetical protein [Chloroherpetonaceae bacterium]MCS7212473.1 hypothetical protein [Chloroherpetonaceae bacterium]MDW8018667.1 hypothetical protein [Chloroherpetonaceae bacterium]MDW8466269.1 hypothetical protein [Chloroherpetonaceae bacterium]
MRRIFFAGLCALIALFPIKGQGFILSSDNPKSFPAFPSVGIKPIAELPPKKVSFLAGFGAGFSFYSDSPLQLPFHIEYGARLGITFPNQLYVAQMR